MKKIYKILCFLFITLFLITGIFTFMKKVGLCAGIASINSSDVPPLPYANGLGSPSQDSALIQTIINTAISKDSRVQNHGYFITPYEVNSDGTVSQWLFCSTISGGIYYAPYPSQIGVGQGYSVGSGSYTFDCITSADGSYISHGYGSYVINFTFTSDFLSLNLQDSTYDFTLKNVRGYPYYIDPLSNFNLNWDIYSPVPDGQPGHTKGAFISDYIESNSEVSSQLPQVDTNYPSDSTSIPRWFKKTLNGIGVINNSIQAGISSIGGWIGQIIDSLEDKFSSLFDILDDIKNTIAGLFDGTTQQQIVDTWSYEFEHSDLYGIVEIKNYINTNYISVLSNINAPESLSFDVDLFPIGIPNLNTGNTDSVYLFGRSVHLDFGWYIEQKYGGRSIRDIIVPVVAVFLYIGMVYGLFFKLPSLIHGVGGWSQHIHSTVSHTGKSVRGV